MLDRMLEASGDLRVRINTVFGAINRLSHEASLHGPSEKTNTLLLECDEAIRSIGLATSFLTPTMVEAARGFMGEFHRVLDDMAAWANLTTVDERNARADATSEDLRRISLAVTAAFSLWLAQFWDLHEKALGATEASQLPRLPIA
jgi:hypothetical protein